MVRHLVFLIACVAVGLAGCRFSPRAKPADPAAARAALQRGLNSWKTGQAIDSLPSQTPPITFIDHDWRAGAKLTAFKIEDRDAEVNFSRHFTVTLSIQDRQGLTSTKKAVYSVVTAPAIVVTREEL